MDMSRYLPCAECGASVDRTATTPHVCNPDRLAEFRMFAVRDEVAGFDAEYQAYLATPHGRFDQWLAARELRRSS